MKANEAATRILNGDNIHETLTQMMRESQDPDLVQLNNDLKAIGFRSWGILGGPPVVGSTMRVAYIEDTTKFKWGPSATGDHTVGEEIGYTQFDPAELDEESFNALHYAVEKAKPVIDHFLDRKGLEGSSIMTTEWPENAISVNITKVPEEPSEEEPKSILEPKEEPEPPVDPEPDGEEWTE